MSKIYISDETIQKYLKRGIDRQALSIAEKFRANREDYSRQKINNKVLSDKHVHAQKIQIKDSSVITTLSKDALEAMKLFNLKTPISKKEARKLLRAARKAKKKQRVPIGVVNDKRVPRAVGHNPLPFSMYAPNSNKSTTRKSQKNDRPLINTKNNDAYNFAGEYSSRNVEFGHGRKKSMEWNEKSATSFSKELTYLRELRKSDPNTFDREAMK